MKEKKGIKKPIKILLIIVVTIAILMGACVGFYSFLYGTFSIPHWMRPTHDAFEPVENYHSYLNFDEPKDSLIPRIDIVMDEDYMLSKADYTKCTVQISNADEYNLSESEAKIKIRGNTTQYADKKPYKIKFSEKTSLFGGGKEKSWVLLANVNDITGLHNYVSMEIARKIMGEGTFVSMVQFVNLYINGEYQGVYNLCDQIETGDKRVPISGKVGATPEETDYLIENDKYAYYKDSAGEEGLAWFWLDKTFAPIEVKSPEPDDDGYTKEYTEYIKKRMDDIYDVILTRDWNAIQKVVDTDSIINGFLVSMIADNGDIAYKSVYYHLPAGGKLTYGPVWDMDLTFGAGTSRGYQGSIIEKAYLNAIFRMLFKVPEFKAAFMARYREIYPEMGDFISATIDDAVALAGKDLENEFEIRKQWGRQGTKEYKAAQTYSESIDFMKKWTHERLDYLYSLYK